MLIAVGVLTITMTLDSGVIAAACAGLCAIGLLVLFIDVRRAPRRSEIEPEQPEEHHITTVPATNCSASTTFNGTWNARSMR